MSNDNDLTVLIEVPTIPPAPLIATRIGAEARCTAFAVANLGWLPPAARVAADGALRCRLVVTFARLVDLVGALPCPLAAGAGAVPGGAELVGHLRP